MLETHDLTLTRGKATILRGLSLSLRAGEVTAICGPNGAGKSTLLAALAGLDEAEAAHVALNGMALAQMSPRERAQRIGYLPQAGEVAWNIDVATLAGLGRLPWRTGAAEDAAAVRAALDALDLAGFEQRSVQSLSGGERARALLARVLAGQPGWILADEPLAALDLSHQLALLSRFAEAGREGKGVVLVLHDLGHAMNHADRVVVLDGGRIVADGPPEQALAEEIIASVWGVSARWLGVPGGYALVPACST